MDWLGSFYNVETADDGRELSFHVRSSFNLLSAIFAGGGAVGLVYAVLHRRILLIGFWLLWLYSTIKPLLHPVNERIIADEGGLHLDGARVRWQEIRGFDYDAGGEDSPSYFVVRTVSGPHKLFSGIGRSQSEAMIVAISKRFPYAPMADDPGPPTLFGKWSEPTTLGLGKKDS